MSASRKAKRAAERAALKLGKASAAEEVVKATTGRVAYEVAVCVLTEGSPERQRGEKILGNMRHLEVATLAPAMRAARIAIRAEMDGRKMSRAEVNQWLDDRCNANDEVKGARRTYIELDAELRGLLRGALPRLLAAVKGEGTDG
jgi:hypothetical protein